MGRSDLALHDYYHTVAFDLSTADEIAQKFKKL